MNIGLMALFVAGFVSSTLLPGGSEPLLVAHLAQQSPAAIWPTVALAVLTVGLGNTLGGLATYGMGRGGRYLWGRWRQEVDQGRQSHQKARHWLDRWGPWALLLSWIPIVGDPLCLVAGAMRLRFWPCALAIAVGKFARYVVLAGAVVAIQA
ncbi:MAG: DedA family protein [Burkholderiaceae bacterium]|nr:DedA family protein [Burkholderiaceae bacterium]MCD8517434.1 DedA family protein [Burkholderiaceae bacterium]MCD8536960.1 DedA family protein [Burkholderiaceae bacterium]MCD8564953.1 DedA family protein [Burkholderiaceae bacterium]